MKHATARKALGTGNEHAGARQRFAVAGVALALAAGLGTPVLARTLASVWTLPIEATLVGVGFLVALGFLAAGWAVGRRVDCLSDEARRDPITQVGNRRHWEECLAIEVDRATKAKMPLSLIMVDVDNLKKLNDNSGHGAGDVALSIVGDVLNESCRARDVAARFGGDEFAVLLPRTRAAEASVVAERIRTALAEHRVGQGAEIEELLTVSIGVCDLASVDEPTPKRLFDGADRALYAAKEGGRDRVEVYVRPPSTSGIIRLDDHRDRKKSARSIG